MVASGPLLCPVMVGRDELLRLADLRLADVLAGHGHCLLIGGEAGLGKTRLVGAIAERAAAVGVRAATGWVAPQDQDLPAASVLDLARSMLRNPALASLGEDLLRLRDDAVNAERVGRRLLVLEMVDRVRAGLDAPTLLVFEDLQWADDLSLEIIGQLAKAAGEVPLMLVGAYRTEEVPPGTNLRAWRTRLITQRAAEEIRLEPLTIEQTATMTTMLLAMGLPAPRDVVEALHVRTDGVPLHIEELLGAIALPARLDADVIKAAAVPETLEDAVLTRLHERSPAAQATARAGAVLGRCFVADVLAGIMDLPVDALDEPLRELVDYAILEPPGPRGMFDFRHQVLRDVLYRDTPDRDRRRFHARAGEFGARLEGASEVHASLHYEQAGMRDRAYASALEGACQASRLHAHREAYELLRRAVDNAPEDLPPRERGDLLANFAEEAASVEENHLALRMAFAAEATFRDAAMTIDASRALLIVLSMWRRIGKSTSDRLALAERVLVDLDAEPATAARDRVRVELLCRLAIVHLDRSSVGAAREAIRAASADALAREDTEQVLATDWIAGSADILAGDVGRGLAAIERSAVAMERFGYEDSVSAYRDGSELAIRHLEYGVAAQFIAEGSRHADEIQQSHCGHVLLANRALLAWTDGSWDQAQARGERAVADRGCERASSMARWSLGYVAMGRGRFDQAREILSDALAYGTRSEAVDLSMPPAWGLAETALLSGDAEDAVRYCEDAATAAAVVGQQSLLISFVVTGVRAYQGSGRPQEASRWLEHCRVLLADIGTVARPSIDHGQGLVELASGAVGHARRDLESAVRGWTERGRVWEADWCRLDLASSLIRSNRFAMAAGLASDVRESAVRLESPALLARADELVRQARGHVAVDEPWRPLTAREYEVARLVSEGRTNPEIAGTLGIAPKTASSHVEHILAKLGATRRAEIASWASNIRVDAQR